MISMIVFVDVVVAGVLALAWVLAIKAAPKRTRPSGGSRWQYMQRGTQIACYLILTGIALVPLLLLNHRLAQIPAQTKVYGVRTSAKNAQLEHQVGCPNSNNVVLTLTIRSVDLAQATADANVRLFVGDKMLRNLTVQATGVRPVTPRLTVSRAHKSFLHAAFVVSYRGSLPEVSWTRYVTIGSILRLEPLKGLRSSVDLGMQLCSG